MTRYTVLWADEVEAAFIEAWVKSLPAVRSVLTQAANWIDSELAADPHSKGRASEEFDLRTLVVPNASTLAKITAAYRVLPEDRVVRVVRLTFTVNN